MCVFEGTVCLDGSNVVVLTDRETMQEARIDSANECWDYRHYEPTTYEMSGGCRSSDAGDRPYNVRAHPAAVGQDFPLFSPGRWWGPHNRHHVFFREINAGDVYGADGKFGGIEVDSSPGFVEVAAPRESEQEAAARRRREQEAAEFADGADAPSPSQSPFPASQLALSCRTYNRVTNLTVEWLPDDSGLYLAATPGQFSYNPFHWMAALVGPLYAAVRNNASGPPGSHPLDGFMQGLPEEAVAGASQTIKRGPRTPNRVAWRVGPQWDLPPMSLVAALGDGAREVPSAHHLLDWMASSLRLAVGGHAPGQPPPQLFFNDLLSRYSRSRLLCARRAVLPSSKPRLFSSASDAWIFRVRAYMHAGIDPAVTLAHPHHPPRHITMIDRAGMHGRSLWNRRVLLDALEASDVPYTLVDRMDGLSFKEQVALMARTGLLIGVHGAALANIAFLPQHAAVVELFPPGLKKDTYRNLASKLGLHYFPVYSRAIPASPFAPGGPNITGFFGQEVMTYPAFRAECVATNISSFDALVAPHCQWASKTLPVIVPRRAFRETLRDALDAIAAFSLLNPAWKAIAEERGLPPPHRLHAFDGWEDSW